MTYFAGLAAVTIGAESYDVLFRAPIAFFLFLSMLVERLPEACASTNEADSRFACVVAASADLLQLRI